MVLFLFILFYILIIFYSLKRPELGVFFVWLSIWIYPNTLFNNIIPFNLRFDDLLIILLFTKSYLIKSSKIKLWNNKIFLLSFAWWIIFHVIPNFNGSFYINFRIPLDTIFKYSLKALIVPLTVGILILNQNKINIRKNYMGLLLGGAVCSLLGIATVYFPTDFDIFFLNEVDNANLNMSERLDSVDELYRRARGSVGIVSTSVICSITALFSFFLIVSKNKKIFTFNSYLYLIFILSLVGLFHTQSRGPIISTGFGLLITLIYYKKYRYIIFSASFFTILLLFNTTLNKLLLNRFSGTDGTDFNQGIGNRFEVWIDIFTQFDPILLIGGVSMHYTMYLYNATVHNTYFGSLIYGGILGVTLILILISKSLMLGKSYKTAVEIKNSVDPIFIRILLILLLVLGITMESMQHTITMQVFFFFLTIIAIEKNRVKIIKYNYNE
ncbi:O-antigen ligase family protein [Oceanihabitans sediminis]|uniref:O-antigen ligase family protein n=1 Tax=Oceanihabitans sediminis TaxID=1812012 RepID=UPI00299D5DB6|nr:O-antigen ligase family protein [Oceanihabitans sediminis]MDX1774866.1 O-antigen ligase family protein [Oceanihabitans sediminis]